ncbi:hypothetical protein [Aquihabitans sp. McL0605]|uniref:hypothetical protein n=1 Tax=Aquihabitans sp. McL0605 TaxID=3415671 RepID=UPI003CF2C6F7
MDQRSASRARAAAAVVFLVAVGASGLVACSSDDDPNAHGCDRQVVLLGDSRNTEQATVIPETANELIGRILGNEGVVGKGDRRQYVKILAAPGTVHRSHAKGLKAFTATCSAKERPLVIDTMGTNYSYAYATATDDAEFWSDLRTELTGFYRTNAPNAVVALEELFFDLTKVPADKRASTQRFVDGYNQQVLKKVAAQDEGHFLFVPKPAEMAEGKFAFRDDMHPTSSSLLAFYEGGVTLADPAGARAFDRASLSLIERGGSACALLDDLGYSKDANSQSRILMAELALLNPNHNPAVATWLDAAAEGPYRLSFRKDTDDCRSQL